MRSTTTTDEATISRDELALWIEQYHDGTIAEDAARQLGALIHGRDDVADWIVTELEFAGLLAQALHDVDRESFVRAFVERLASERGSDADGQARTIARSATAQVQAARAEQNRPASLAETLASLITGVASQFTVASSTSERRRVRTGRVALLVLILGTVTAGAAWVFLAPPSVGTLSEFSKGVVVLRGNAQLLPTPNMQLRAGDALSVPRGGTASARCGSSAQIELLDYASATFKSNTADLAHVNLIRGELKITGPADATQGMVISTPHARVHTGPGLATITATASSTRVKCGTAGAVVTRIGDAAQLKLPTGHHAIIGPGSPLEALADK